MSVVVSLEDTGVCRKQITVEVPADVVGAETRRVVASYANQVALPGFRKGKVPRSLLRNRFREDIDREVVERLVPRYWEKARQEKELDPLGQPQLQEVGDLKEDEPLRFVAVVEVRPAIELGEVDPAAFELPEVEVEPSDEDVDSALEDLRRQIGDWKTVDRAAARGDQAVVRIVEETEGGEAPSDEGAGGEGEAEAEEGAEGGDEGSQEAGRDEEGQEIRLEVGDPNVWEELSLAVTGLAAGQEGRFTRRPPAPPEPAEGEEAAAVPEPRTFRIRVEEVQERELPPLDDELAGKLGDFQSVDEVREAMRAKLRHDRGHERDSRRREAVLEQLRQRHTVPLPEGVLHEETQGLLNEYAQDIARRGVDPRNAGIDWDRMGEQFRPMAERRLHDRLLLDAVAASRDVQVSPAEVEGAVASIARSQGVSVKQVREALGDRLEGLARQIRREKAMKWLLGEDEAADGSGATESALDATASTPEPETEAAPAEAATEPAAEAAESEDR